MEALARGPADGPLARPDDLFAVARRAGRLAELDAVPGTRRRGRPRRGHERAPRPVRERRAADGRDQLIPFAATSALAARGVRIVAELTERDLTADPARAVLLRRPGAGPRVPHRPRRRRGGPGVVGADAVPAPRGREARPAPRAGPSGPRGRRDHVGGRRLRRAQRGPRARRGRRECRAPGRRAQPRRDARPGVLVGPAMPASELPVSRRPDSSRPGGVPRRASPAAAPSPPSPGCARPGAPRRRCCSR